MALRKGLVTIFLIFHLKELILCSFTSVKVSDELFSSRLRNPCCTDKSITTWNNVTELKDILQDIKTKTVYLKKIVKKAIDLRPADSCSSVYVPEIASIHRQHSNSTLLSSLSSYYRILLIHVAHIFYINETWSHLPSWIDDQQSTNEDNELINLIKIFSGVTQDYICGICVVSKFNNTESNYLDVTNSVLNMTLEMPNTTSRKQIKFCQIFKSTSDFLVDFFNYLSVLLMKF